jgi:cytochrome P450
MLYIMTSPRIYAALNAEIDTAISKKLISRPVIRSEEAQRLPYLQAVLKEGLRIFPPGTGILPKQVPPEGDTFNGIFLPGGTEIGINMWAISRNTDVFGADAAAFRPERWLEASLQDYSRMESAQEMVWGYGKFMCLGREIALIELNKIFVEVSDWYL